MQESERDLLFLAVLGFALYYLFGKVQQQASNLLAPVSDAIASAWLAATLPSPMDVLGNVVFPDGSQVAVSALSLRANSQTGAVQVMYSGHIYALSPSDANGNWPAVLVQ